MSATILQFRPRPRCQPGGDRPRPGAPAQAARRSPGYQPEEDEQLLADIPNRVARRTAGLHAAMPARMAA